MEISETRVKLTGNANDRLKAVCSVTLDAAFVVRDIKVIDGASGLFVAMPSRKLADHCPKCRNKNHLRARFCNDCGAKLDENRADRDHSGRMKLHADIAHPINSECRGKFQSKVVEAFLAEVEKSKQPDYRPVDFEDDEEGAPVGHDDFIADLKREADARHAKRSGDSSRGREVSADDLDSDEAVREAPAPPPQRAPAPSRQREPMRPVEPRPSANDGFAAGL